MTPLSPEEELHKVRMELVELQNRCNVCICGEGATDECCRSCIAGGADVFTQLKAAKALATKLRAVLPDSLVHQNFQDLRALLREFERLVDPDTVYRATCGTLIDGPTVIVQCSGVTGHCSVSA